MGRGATLDRSEQSLPNDGTGAHGEMPSFPGRQDFEPRPPRQQIDTSSIEDAMRRRSFQSAQRDFESDPRALLIRVTHWIPEPVAGLPNASQRAERFGAAMERVAALLESGDREAAFEEFCSHASEVDTALYLQELSPKDSERRAGYSATVALFVQNGRALEQELRASVDPQSPGQRLRTLEELNIAEGKAQSENLEALYREIILVHEPSIAAQPAAAVENDNDYETQVAAVTAFNEAVALYRDAKYSEAEAAFKKFTEEYAAHELSARAEDAQSACIFARAKGGLAELRALAESPETWDLASTKHFWDEGVVALNADAATVAETHPEKAASLLLQLGDLHSGVGQHTQALECFSRTSSMLSEGPLAAYASFSKALAQQELGQQDAAAASFADFVEHFPKDSRLPEALLRQAHLALEREKREDARALYRKVLEVTEGGDIRERALFELAQLESADRPSAIALLTELQQTYPDSHYQDRANEQLARLTVEQQFAEAEHLSASAETLDAALEKYKEIAEQHSETSIGELAEYRLLYHYAEKGDTAAVLTEVEVFLERYPQSEMRVDVRQAQAQAFAARGDTERALLAYSGLLREFPQDERKNTWQTAVTSLGTKQRAEQFAAVRELASGEPEQFAAALEQYIERYPGDERIERLQFNLATRYAAADSTEKALGILSQLQQSEDSEIALRSTLAAAQLQLTLGNQSAVQELSLSVLANENLPAPAQAFAQGVLKKSVEADLASASAESLERVEKLLPQFASGLERDAMRFSLLQAFRSAGLSASAEEHGALLCRESRSVYGLKARLELGSMQLQNDNAQAAGIRFAEVANTPVLQSYSDGFRAQIQELQIEGLLGMCEAYAALGSQTHLTETIERVRRHPAFSDAIAERLESIK